MNIDFLKLGYWQGIAGIAQILAAVFSIITIRQAKKMYKQAENERKQSVAPDWDVVKFEFLDTLPEKVIPTTRLR